MHFVVMYIIMYLITEHNMDYYMLCLIVYVLQSNVIPFRKPIRFRCFI